MTRGLRNKNRRKNHAPTRTEQFPRPGPPSIYHRKGRSQTDNLQSYRRESRRVLPSIWVCSVQVHVEQAQYVRLRALCDGCSRTPPGPEGSNGNEPLRVPQITRSLIRITRTSFVSCPLQEISAQSTGTNAPGRNRRWLRAATRFPEATDYGQPTTDAFSLKSKI